MPPHVSGSEVPLHQVEVAHSRSLLLSLEELRDSLSTRVDQLSDAVERLRGETRQLERTLNEDDSLGLNRLVIDGVSQLLVYLGGTSVWSAD
jgi:hypothetical protein